MLDEADRLLDMEFTEALDKILKLIPKERTTYLYSATMTTKVAKLQRASLTNPIRVEVSSKCVASFQNSFTCPDMFGQGTRRCQLYCNIIYSCH